MTETAAPLPEAIDLIRATGGDSFELCYQCGLCDTVCPWNLLTTFTVRRLVREAQFGILEIEAESIWQCAACGKCPDRCPRGVRIVDVLVSARRIAMEQNMLPQGIRVARGSLAGEGNPWNGKPEERTNWADGLSVKAFAENTEILYFPCCTQCYDMRARKTAIATANILAKAEVDFGIIEQAAVCCGESIRKAGDEQVFKRLARENIKTFIEKGVKRILVSSPHCYEAFKNDYPEFMVNFDVLHISEYFLEMIQNGRIEFTKAYDQKVAYHDPCYLGRHNLIYDQPREILKRIPGLELVEMADSRDESLCCGGGGGRIWVETPKGERLSDLRLQQAMATGASVLATFCPYCILNFEDSRLSLEAEHTIEIRDVSEIIQEVT